MILQELDEAFAILEAKYSSQPPYKQQRIQRVVVARYMVVNALQKIDVRICPRLRLPPTVGTPWCGDFTMDKPREMLSVIFEEILKHDGYGYENKETAACIEVNVTEKKNAVLIFHHINTERDVIAKEEILKKKFKSNGEDSLEKCEVLVSPSTPLKLKYSKNSGVLSAQFCYGYWNAYGVPRL